MALAPNEIGPFTPAELQLLAEIEKNIDKQLMDVDPTTLKIRLELPKTLTVDNNRIKKELRQRYLEVGWKQFSIDPNGFIIELVREPMRTERRGHFPDKS